MTFDKKYYQNMFADILADVACYDTPEQNAAAAEAVLAGFVAAIDDWLKYHKASYDSFATLRKKVIDTPFGITDDLTEEEAQLPPIPAFPSL